ASHITRLSGGLRKRTVLRLGFGVIMILLVIAGVLSYKIQKRTARAIAETYSRYIQQTDALTEFHHNFLMGEINLRDLLLSEREDSLQFYKDNLARLRQKNNEALATIKRLSGVNVAGNPLAAHSEEFWDTLEAVYHWPASRRDSLGYEFLQQEIVPRGNR